MDAHGSKHMGQSTDSQKLDAPRSDVPAKPWLPEENALASGELGEPTKARSKSKFTSDCIKISMSCKSKCSLLVKEDYIYILYI